MTLHPGFIRGGVGPLGAAAKAAEPWWLAGGISASACVAAYQPKGAASYADSLKNINNPGTNDLTSAVGVSWDISGWKEGGAQYFDTFIDMGSLPVTAIWNGVLAKKTLFLFSDAPAWNGLRGHTYDDGKLYIGMNSTSGYRFEVSISDFSVKHTIAFQKLADNKQNLWIDGVLVTGSPKSGSTPGTMQTRVGVNKECRQVVVYNAALSETQVLAVTDAMSAL